MWAKISQSPPFSNTINPPTPIQYLSSWQETTVTSRANKFVTFISLLHHKTHFEISPTFRWNDCIYIYMYIARTNKYVVQKAHKMFCSTDGMRNVKRCQSNHIFQCHLHYTSRHSMNKHNSAYKNSCTVYQVLSQPYSMGSVGHRLSTKSIQFQ